MWQNWTIRKTVKKGDYLYAVVPEHPKADKHGYVLEHRIVLENKLGRLLLDNEQGHHINGDRHDNRPENLEVMLFGEHQRMHIKMKHPEGQRMVKLVCANCGKEFDRPKRRCSKNKGTKNDFCSRRCNGLYNGFKKKA